MLLKKIKKLISHFCFDMYKAKMIVPLMAVTLVGVRMLQKVFVRTPVTKAKPTYKDVLLRGL